MCDAPAAAGSQTPLVSDVTRDLFPGFEFSVLKVQRSAVFFHCPLEIAIKTRVALCLNLNHNPHFHVRPLREQQKHLFSKIGKLRFGADRVNLDSAIEPAFGRGCDGLDRLDRIDRFRVRLRVHN